MHAAICNALFISVMDLPFDIQYFPEPIPSDQGPDIFYDCSKAYLRCCSKTLDCREAGVCLSLKHLCFCLC